LPRFTGGSTGALPPRATLHLVKSAPADHRGASRAATAAPTTIEVVRSERTIVRDVDEQLPLILSGTALLLVLAGLAVTLARTRMAPRPRH
jgi:hypothetical protein